MTHPAILKDYESRAKTYVDLIKMIKSIAAPIFVSRLRYLEIDTESELEDFATDFVTRKLTTFRRIESFPANYQPKTQKQVAEFLAFAHQSAINKIQVRFGCWRQMAWLGAFSWCDRCIRQRQEVSLNEEVARAEMISHDTSHPEIEILLDYLELKQPVYRKYLELELQGYRPLEIQEILGLTHSQRMYTKDSITRHSRKFAEKVKLGVPLDGRLPVRSASTGKLVLQDSITLVSPRGHKYTVSPSELRGFCMRAGLKNADVRSLIKGQVLQVNGWHLAVLVTTQNSYAGNG